jgi:hypothetical protein
MKNNRFLTLLGWFFGIFFLLGALVSIQHPFLALFYGLLGFILLPPGHLWIEKKLKFRLTIKVKSLVVVALFAATIPLAFHYAKIDKRDEEGQAEIGRNEQQKKDSLNFYIQVSSQFKKEHKIDEASKELHRALVFASSKDDKDLIAKDSIDIAITEAIDLVKSGKYLPALDQLNRLIAKNGRSRV